MVENAAQGVEGIIAGGGIFHRLADGDAQAPSALGVFGQDAAPDLSVLAGAGHTLSTPGLHHHSAIGLLIVADLDHIDFAFQAEELAAQGQGAAPLPGASLRGQAFSPFLLSIVCLGHGSVWLMAAGSADPFVFVEDLCRGIKRLLQPIGAD